MPMNNTNLHNGSNRLLIRLGLSLLILGLLIFVLGADPALFGLDRSPVMGFVQNSVFLSGPAFN